MYTATLSLLEHVVPMAASKNGVYNMMDYAQAIPPSMIVATSAWSMHPDLLFSHLLIHFYLSIGSNVHLLWIIFSTTATYMIPFGTGSRMCGGHNLAQVMFPAVMECRLFSPCVDNKHQQTQGFVVEPVEPAVICSKG